METMLYAVEMERQPKGRDDTVLWDFYPSIFVTRLSNRGVNVYRVIVTPFEGHEDDALYWAWWDEKRQEFQFVYYHKNLVKMCFTYGVKVCEERGDGKLLPVQVEIIDTILPSDPDEKGGF